MLIGILGTKSTLVANVARFLDEPRALRYTERRLCGLLKSPHPPWDDLKERTIEVGGFQVGRDDVIAFDPGDVIKEYAEKMENLYSVHDGSRDECGNGFEAFSVEAVQLPSPTTGYSSWR